VNAMTEIVKRMEQTEKKHPKIKKVLIKDTIEVSDSVAKKATPAHAEEYMIPKARKKNKI
jgi:pyrimidine deaminase RibD-like protein